MRQPTDLMPVELVRAVAAVPLAIGVALRTPWDAALYPAGVPALRTCSIRPGSLDALAAVLVGTITLAGRRPVAVPGFPA